ncbi:MAG TPA: hypothetical protein VHW65_05135 [Gemmatimonadales bacterium]|jgi:predicted Zn-dependent protease|nr:hypothetical protein [Gemmatimonadales bacterium]
MRRLFLVAVVLATGCSQLVFPQRDDFYAFADVVSKNGVNDTLTFHWPRSSLPVRVWIASDDALVPDLANALARWQSVFLYGEFTTTMVADSNQADIIVQNVISPEMTGLAARAGECSGETDLDTGTAAPLTLQLPVHVYVWANGTTTGLEPCYGIAMTHEMGHAIGILAHSTSIADVMFAQPVIDTLSSRDRQTAEVVYHVSASLVPVGRR